MFAYVAEQLGDYYHKLWASQQRRRKGPAITSPGAFISRCRTAGHASLLSRG